VAFDVMLHLGTLFAVIVYFWSDILQIVRGTVAWIKRREGSEEASLFLWIIVATIPTGLMGVIFKDWFESLFSSPVTCGFTLLITGTTLWLTRFVQREGKAAREMRWRDAFLIGVAQGVAIIPGISRSGATLSTGIFCHLRRELAGKFSFLLSVPAILGATVLKFREIETDSGAAASLFGAAAAFLVGLFTLKLLMKMIRMGKLSNFSYYCWAVGILMILLAR